ncbi:MAG: hypothetical protein CMJ62_05925 [Planctomycetaceae bacterium]|nr:hypothetical protein [Planctomycetaceae bacterium]
MRFALRATIPCQARLQSSALAPTGCTIIIIHPEIGAIQVEPLPHERLPGQTNRNALHLKKVTRVRKVTRVCWQKMKPGLGKSNLFDLTQLLLIRS